MNEIEKLKAKDTETALMICSDAAKQADMFHIAETMADAADCIEQLLKEIERLQKYERAVEQILKPDADEMMGRTP